MANPHPQPPTFARSGSSNMTQSSFHGPGGVASFSATASSTPAGTPPPPTHLDMRDGPPQIYTAVYSGVPVYEMTVNNVAVMRRREDSWLNATQILKVAGVEKGKRTKVLEKEILCGKHEKVQGGYGKYQGTWIDFERGREFCKAYGVEDLLAPLLNLEAGTDGPDTPTKEQAMAAKRKRMYNSSLSQGNGNGPLFPPISSTVTNAFTALGRANSGGIEPPRQAYPQIASSSQVMTQESWPPPPASLVSETSFGMSQHYVDSTYASQNFSAPDSQLHEQYQEPPRKRPRGTTPPNELPLDAAQNNTEAPTQALPPVDAQLVSDAEQVRQTLMNLFINPDVDAISSLEGLSPEQIDMPLDSMGSAAIHWAASLARVNLIRALIAKGASIYRVNDAGETALVRGCFCTNNFDQSSFPQLLNLLHPTISIGDNNGRTILHHIALKSGMKGRSADGRYYLHCLLEFIAKNGASSNTTNQRGSGPKVMNLGRFVTDIVNAQDKSGDTALNIAARIGNKSIVHPLLEVGADVNIPNRAGLRPIDFGIGGEPTPLPQGREQSWTVPPAVVQKREDIVKSMKEIITNIEKDFQTEISQKQDQVSTTLNQLREVTLKLGKERERMEELKRRAREHQDLRQHCQNLRRAIEEENDRFQRDNAGTTNGVMKENPEADEPWTMQTQLLAPVNNIINLTKQQREYVCSLPPASVLKARVRGYRHNEESLREKAGKLHDRSTDLEEKFRRVVALCTGVEEERVDSLLEGLVQAVESDPGEVDTARVTSFLRKVDESAGSD